MGRLTYPEAKKIAENERAGAFPNPTPDVERILAQARQVELRGDAWGTQGDRRRRRTAVLVGLLFGGYVAAAAAALILFTIPW